MPKTTEYFSVLVLLKNITTSQTKLRGIPDIDLQKTAFSVGRRIFSLVWSREEASTRRWCVVQYQVIHFDSKVYISQYIILLSVGVEEKNNPPKMPIMFWYSLLKKPILIFAEEWRSSKVANLVMIFLNVDFSPNRNFFQYTNVSFSKKNFY